MKLGKTSLLLFAGFPLVISPILQSGSTAYAHAGLSEFPDPVDEESWVLPRDMTWDDYQPVPGIDWRDTEIEADREIRGALILVDFPDQEFILSQPEGSDPAGNPIAASEIPEEELGEWWEDFLNTPQSLNNYRTVDEFWRENSYGGWAVELDAFGPYTLEHKEFQYGLNEFGQQENMPEGYSTQHLVPDAQEAAQEDIEASGVDYDFEFIIHSGYDESSLWQEFGEMMFESPEDVTDEFGSPFEDHPNSATTRYVDWTSWFAAKSIWSHAYPGGSVQAENSGQSVFAHEFGHIEGLGDNYNNPYADPVSRSYSGPWELMSRGAFNGPGGPHTRWMIPATEGSSAPSHHMLRNKIKQDFVTEGEDYLEIDRDDLAAEGPVFQDILARAVPSGPEFNRDELHGINITMDEDLTPKNDLEDDWRADMQAGEDWYDNYTIEVVDQVGFDSFQPDAGVLLAKTKDEERPPFIWAIDAHPEDINEVDFERPDGTTQMLSKGDYQQLADALFKAGTADGVVSEYKDEHNRLHFYVLDKNYDEDGALSYRTAVRHMDEAGPYERGVDVDKNTVVRAEPGRVAEYNFSVTNNGEETDLIRLSVDIEDEWEYMLEHDVIEVEAGESVDVPVYVDLPEHEQVPSQLTFTATSETDAEQAASVDRGAGVSAASMEALVEQYEEEGVFENSQAPRSLTRHLTAVSHYEEQGDTEKVITHMEGFKDLLDHQLDNVLISQEAFDTLYMYTNELIEKLD
ncbi:M6 family metalloprotease-like protein [Geomicrobium halophilum]|uniref:M6 family metalloprotease-like protein n=1 Tax=Geomicrobium halophilum TaxID=549000 RepID=A0A841PU39_9BACL|nr:immune inhibitor A domain-containing protein [Geomicrobium halophilum]MBB6451284.1 M6 family metalloprotease-like protein [Geomicrobium halophilum]